jgi:Ca2+-transporting ATPase
MTWNRMAARTTDARSAELPTGTAPLLGRPHAVVSEAVLAALGADVDGLSAGEAATRLDRYGPNRLAERPGVPAWRLALDEVRNPLVLLLLAATGVLTAVSLLRPAEAHWGDAGLILAIVVLNGALGFVQNYRAQRGIEALQRLSVPVAQVIRGGERTRIAAEVLVPGDIVLLEEGDRIPADGRLLRAHELRVDESSLTGESMTVDKVVAPVAADTPLAERADMVYTGTAVVAGRGRYVVTGTGMSTEIGAIAEAVQAVEEGPTPFQRDVARLGRQITVVIGALIVLIAVLQLTVGGQDLLATFVSSVALAVAAIPEGLPVVMTLALAFGTRRMLGRNALVRSLPVVEIIGATDVVCTDKTGTITEGRMSVGRLITGDHAYEVTGSAGEPVGDFVEDGVAADLRDHPALRVAALCNDAHRGAEGEILGDPTEVALLVAAFKAGVDIDAWDREAEIPFSSERKRMSVVVRRGERPEVLVKGAPEVVLERCTRLHGDGSDDDGGRGERPFRPADRARIDAEHELLAEQAYRVLALAGKPAASEPAPSDPADAERDLVFYGLAAIADPPRGQARPALEATGGAGVRVVMITGDNPRTAAAVGREIGLEGDAIGARELDELDDDTIVERGRIFARVEPAHKLRILQAFRDRGDVVVMTGDGVNDAPALKGADVGIAMGQRGTDVAREASDMVLLDDNFATIVAAIEEGRRIAANIRKFLTYLLTGNLAEVLLILLASLFGYLPISAVQILWVNLVTDSGPALALAVDPPAPGLMRQPPRRGPILSRPMVVLVATLGVLFALVATGIFAAGLALFDLDTARTMTFTALVAKEYVAVAVLRVHEGAPVASNRWLLVAVAMSLGLQLLLVYSPLGALFDAVPLGLPAWGVIGVALLVAIPISLAVGRLVRDRLGPL